MVLRPRPGVLRGLLPATRWGKVALALLVLFAIARSLMWASAQPGWFAPDEDYHWHYVEHLLIEKEIPDLDEPFATQELFNAVVAVNHGHYVSGPRTEYNGDPHALVAEMKRLGGHREATGEQPRQVLHPPLYHLGAVLVDRAVTERAALTRLTAMRYWSVLLGAIGVWAVWLLASQVLARTWQQLAAAALVATQPIVAFSASTMTNDVLALLAYTLVVAWCARALRAPPRPAHGIVLGALVGIALLSKATLTVTIPLAVLTLAMSARACRISMRRLAQVGGAALLMLVAATAWWYRISLSETHSLLGTRASVTSGPPQGPPGTGLGFFDAAYEWLSQTYVGYWFNYLDYEVTRHDFWYYLPLAIGCIGIAAVLATAVSQRRHLFDPSTPTMRHVVLLLAAALALVVPPLWFDTRAAMAGQAFGVVQGRFMGPAYPAAAVLFVLAVTHVLRRRPTAAPIAIGGVVLIALINYGHTWVRWCLERFYGPVDGDWIAVFRRASWDKPEWIDAAWFATLALLSIVAFAAAFVLTLLGSRREHGSIEPPQRPGLPAGTRVRTTAAAS